MTESYPYEFRLYGSEVLGYEHESAEEAFQFKFVSLFLFNCINDVQLLKKLIRAGSDLLLNISLSGGQSFKVDQITSAKRE